MLTTLTGSIEDGKLFFDEQLPTNKRGKIILMFVDEIVALPKKKAKGIRLGESHFA